MDCLEDLEKNEPGFFVVKSVVINDRSNRPSLSRGSQLHPAIKTCRYLMLYR